MSEIRKPDLRRPRSSPKARRMTPQVSAKGQMGAALHLGGRLLIGKTAAGRTTFAVLATDHPDAVSVHRSLIEEGRFPVTL